MGFIYFGTKNRMMWVKDPAINMDSSKFGWANQTNFLDGGAHIRRSWGSHKEFNLSWNLSSRDTIRPIQDYADGMYGTGLIYWLNPFTMDKNVLPTAWATPWMGGQDGPILTGYSTRPSLVDTSANTYGYPVQSAVYTVTTTPTKNVWIPIPTGYTLWLGVHGTAGSGGAVIATPTTGPTSTATPVTLPLLPVTTNQLVNTSFDGSAYGGVLLSMGGSGSVILSGMVAQIWPTGVMPPLGDFISGQGHSGCMFVAQPTLTEYNAVIDKVGLSAKLVEVESWL